MIDRWMELAIREARTGASEGGIPIGSVLTSGRKLLGAGHNRRVQQDDPILHAEIDCLRASGRLQSHAGLTLYSTLMPCYMCAGAVVQFDIRRVIVGESRTFEGAADFMRSHGVDVVDLELDVCYEMLQAFIHESPAIWYEDIGTDIQQ